MAYARYTVKVGSFKGGKRYDVNDQYWDRHDYAFTRPDGAFYSYSIEAAQWVSTIIQEAPSFQEIAQPGRCYQIKTDGPFGAVAEVAEVPSSWYQC